MSIPGIAFSAYLRAVDDDARQAAAEYMAVSADAAVRSLQRFGGQATNWIGQNPLLFWGGMALFALLIFATRSRAG
jgi:hypothetical protein